MTGDAETTLRSMPPNSVDLILTSAPFFSLRTYATGTTVENEDIGAELDIATWLTRLLRVVDALSHVLTPHGTMCIELGDGYAHNQQRANDKSLMLSPEAFRFALAYGCNPFNAQSIPSWIIRNVVRWCHPNPAATRLTDKFRPATTEIVVATKSRTRFFDPLAIPAISTAHKGTQAVLPTIDDEAVEATPSPSLDWIIASSKGTNRSHFATWPTELLTPFIESMSPRAVCTECGAPAQRVVETTNSIGVRSSRRAWKAIDPIGFSGAQAVRTPARKKTIGFTDCGCCGNTDLTPNPGDCNHDHWRPGVVLDPFCGSGTTLIAAHGHGRNAVGIDLLESHIEMVRERLGFFAPDE